jgi:aflatoxin B1 aldehyde reductase
MTFGDQVDETTAGRMIDAFLEAGHSRIDTAYVYADGRSEEILGRLLTPARRRQVWLATKAKPLDEGGLQPAQVRHQLEMSLRRLQTDSVDLFYLHHPDNTTPVAETLGECQKLFEEGKFKALGLSNYAAWQVVDIYHICQGNGWVTPTVYQGMYNAVTRAVESELFPALRATGMVFYAYNPLAGGLLAGKYHEFGKYPRDGRFALRENYRERYWKSDYFQALEAIRGACRDCQVDMVTAALNWVLFHSPLTTTDGNGLIIGVSNFNQLTANLNCLRRGPLPEQLVASFEHAWELTRHTCPAYFRT